METTRISKNGHIALPKAICKAKSWRPGQALEVVSMADGVLLKPLKAFVQTRLADVAGSLRYGGNSKSIEQMHAAVAGTAAKRFIGSDERSGDVARASKKLLRANSRGK